MSFYRILHCCCLFLRKILVLKNMLMMMMNICMFHVNIVDVHSTQKKNGVVCLFIVAIRLQLNSLKIIVVWKLLQSLCGFNLQPAIHLFGLPIFYSLNWSHIIKKLHFVLNLSSIMLLMRLRIEQSL